MPINFGLALISRIRPNGTVVDTMVLHKDTRHMDMRLLPKTRTCTMGAFLDMGLTNSQGLTNSHSRSVNLMFLTSFFNFFLSIVLVIDNRDMSLWKLDGFLWLFHGVNCMLAMYNIIL